MNYLEARDLISDGDLIAVKSKKGLLTKLTRFFTRSDYTHVGLAIWMDGGLWMAELNTGRNHLIPLSQLSGVDFDVFEAPTELTQAGTLREAINTGLRSPISYGFVALGVIGLLDWLKIKVSIKTERVLVCSGWCIYVYELAGWKDHNNVVSPRQLCEWLRLKLTVEKTTSK